MSDNTINLILAVFEGKDSAEAVIEKLPKRNRNTVSAVVMKKR